MQANVSLTFQSVEEHVAFCKHMASFTSARSGEAAPSKSESPKAKTPELHAVASAVNTESSKKIETTVMPDTTPSEKVKTVNEKLKEVAEKKIAAEAAEKNGKPAAGVFQAGVFTYDNMKEGILAVSQKYQSKKRAFEILGKFGVEKVTKDIDPGKFEGIVNECQKALEAAE